jgi:clan AA aspartic protease (TIGR02281 family)
MTIGRPFVVAVVTMLMVSTAEAAGGSALNEAGKTAYARGDYESAARLFGEAIAGEPGEPLFHYHRAIALSRLGQLHEAARAYEATLRLDPPPDLRAAARAGLRSITTLTSAAPSRRDDERPRAAGSPPPPRSFGPGSSRDAIGVPVRRAGGVWFTEVVVNATRTARFLVDTGASICVISPQLAAAVSIEPGPGARVLSLQTLSGLTSGAMVSVASLRVGEAEAEQVAAVIHETGDFMDGILGNSFLGRYAVTLDAERSLLWLRPR